MSRKRFHAMECSIARTLDVVGDWWTLLIVREAFLGVRRFAEFRDHLGIARNILAHRLAKLVADGILERRPKETDERGFEYRLTDKGRDLWGVLTALRLWGDRWVYGKGKEPLLVRERGGGRMLAQLLPADAAGTPLDRERLIALPGPGTTPEIASRYVRRAADARSRRPGR